MFLAVDVGTQCLKIAIFNSQGQRVALAKQKIKTFSPKLGYFEQDPNDWWQALIETCQRLPKECLKKIRGIGICGTSLTLVAANLQGFPRMPAILWNDLRAKEEAGAFSTIAPREHLAKVCGREPADFLWPKLLWLKRNSLDIYENSEVFCDCSDWLTFILTKFWSMNIISAVCKSHYDFRKKTWPVEFIWNLGLESAMDRLPEVKFYPFGYLQEIPAQSLGLPHGIPVINMGIDGYAALFGLGCIDAQEDRVVISMGTSWSEFLVTCQGKSLEGVWGPFEIWPSRFVYETGQIQGGDTINWYFSDLEELISMDSVLDKSTMAEAKNIVVKNLLGADRTKIEKFSFPLVQGMREVHTRKHLLQAVYESVALATRENIRRFGKIKNMMVCGGSSQSVKLLQIVADICEVTLLVPEEQEAALLGVAIGVMKIEKQGPIGQVFSVIKPNQAAFGFYQKKYHLS